MAIKFNDGVILGADSRTTTGCNSHSPTIAYIQALQSQIESQINSLKSTTRFGAAEVDPQQTLKPSTISSNTTFPSTRTIPSPLAVQTILKECRAIYDRQPTVQVAASLFQELCYANKGQLSAGLIIAGWDEQAGGQVYHIPAGGSLHKQEFSISGSGSSYIYGYCDSNFHENMSQEEGVEFVKNGIFILGWTRLMG